MGCIKNCQFCHAGALSFSLQCLKCLVPQHENGEQKIEKKSNNFKCTVTCYLYNKFVNQGYKEIWEKLLLPLIAITLQRILQTISISL